MLRFTHKRAGLSLMEALVALFIMAIGMISLLTLFPLGAIQMGRALRDDRCAQCAWQADGVVRTWWQVEVVDKVQAKPDETTVTGPYFVALDGAVPKDSTTQPSMVVAIDPIGWYSGRSTQNLGGSGILRKSSSLVGTLKDSIRLCSLTDDIFFNEQGGPDTVSGSVAGRVVRQGRYNWMALVQRPVNANRTVANLKVLVFDGRAVGSAPANGETLQAVTGAQGSTQLVINIGLSNAAFPPIGKGGWILDPGTGNRMDTYRVQSLTDNGASTTLELDTPLKNAVNQVVILRGLAEVFDRPALAPTTYLNPQP
jgi:Tfp pilus assembly protein PilV